jgi:quercetin dioxygenase-like cupin family protein
MSNRVEVRRRSDAEPLMEGEEFGLIYFMSGKIVLVATTLPPGGHSLYDPGHPGAPETVYCVRGQIVLELGSGDEREFAHLEAGDAALISEGVPHAVHNPGPEQADMVWCAAPDLGRPVLYQPHGEA